MWLLNKEARGCWVFAEPYLTGSGMLVYGHGRYTAIRGL